MKTVVYDAIVIGSGAGGAAAAYHLTQRGKEVLVVERGLPIPRDGSTLDAGQVGRGLCRLQEPWLDRTGRPFFPHEYLSVGGKTKWYGAALQRLPPAEFHADAEHGLSGWPIAYADLEPFYDAAENLLAVRDFAIEPDLRTLTAALRHSDSRWQASRLPLGLSPEILQHADEARHFDGYASPKNLKSDAETCLLGRIADRENLRLLAGRRVVALLGAPGQPRRVIGIACDDGSRYYANHVLLAAGALNSPRLLLDYTAHNGLDRTLPGYANIGRRYKCHLNSVLLALSPGRKTDLLRKTLLLRHPDFPHSSAQPLGWLDGAILANELPDWAPRWSADLLGSRAYGFFLTTEDGSHPDNHIVPAGSGQPVLDYDATRCPALPREHQALLQRLRADLLRRGYLCLAHAMPLAASAHACGTLAAGLDPATSVVDGDGRVHGMDNLYVVDGSALPRSGSVSPALTIYAWALRCASRLA